MSHFDQSEIKLIEKIVHTEHNLCASYHLRNLNFVMPGSC